MSVLLLLFAGLAVLQSRPDCVVNFRLTLAAGCVLLLNLCMTGPTENSADDQGGVWKFTCLETGQLKES